MGNFNFTEDAWSEYVYWQTQDKKTIKKINKLLESINRNGMLEGEGKPEQLKGEFSECYSRRIDEKNRLVYRESENGFEVLKCRGHYSDK